MRRYIWTILLCYMMLLCHAQHYMGFGMATDIPLSLDNLGFSHTTIGGGGEFSGIYAFQYKHFMLQTGVDFGIQCPRLGVDNQELEQPMLDTRGVYFIYRGFLSARTDMSRQIGVGVPFMVGYAGEHAYVIAGARYYRIFSAQSRSSAMLKTIGDYDGRYYDYFENMPNHGYHDYTLVSSSGQMSFGHDVQVCAEVGARIPLSSGYSTHRNNWLHISLWASYSLLDITANASNFRLVEPNYSQYMQVAMTHPYSAVEGANAIAHNLCIGFKASFLFYVARVSDRNKICRCLGVY